MEQYFNDPYSYRLMGIKAIPISFKKMLEKNLETVQKDISNCDLAVSDRNKAAYDDCMRRYEEHKKEAEIEQEYINRGKDVEYHKKRKSILIEYGAKYLEIAKKIELYLLAVEEKWKIIPVLKELSEEEANKLAYYDIRLDCYSKNSLGNEVLGRFSFPFTEDGIFGGKNDVSKVIQLNK